MRDFLGSVYYEDDSTTRHPRSLSHKKRRFSLAKAGNLFGPLGAVARWVSSTRVLRNNAVISES